MANDEGRSQLFFLLLRKSFPSEMSSTSSFNFRNGFDVLKFGVAVFGGYLGLMRVQPTPTAYVSGGVLDKGALEALPATRRCSGVPLSMYVICNTLSIQHRKW